MDTPGKSSETPATTNAALPDTGPITPTPAPTPQNPFPDMEKSLGVAEVLSEPEQMEYFACEEVVGTGWSTFVQVGLALAQIRDHRLYRVDFDCFEAYCQAKWQYGGRYVNRLISAAKVFTYLGTISSLKKPEHETQVQSLIGLTPEQAQLAWQRAVEKAASRNVTAKIVKAAMQELQLGAPAKPVSQRPRQTAPEKRRLIDSAIGELLVLVGQKASYATLTEKIEALHVHIQALLSEPASRTPGGKNS